MSSLAKRVEKVERQLRPHENCIRVPDHERPGEFVEIPWSDWFQAAGEAPTPGPPRTGHVNRTDAGAGPG